MKQTPPFFLALSLALWPLASLRAAGASLGDTFTYQGFLREGGAAANGVYDFQFQLQGSLAGNDALGSPLLLDNVGVTQGVFTVQLDFGPAAFNGESAWLQIGVRAGQDTGAFTPLAPREAITPTPYSLYSKTAAVAGGAPWNGLTGVPTGFADGTDNDTTYSAGAGLALSGTTLSVAPNGIVSSMLAPGVISGANLQSGAISGNNIAAHTITGENIASNEVVRSVNGLKDDVMLVSGDNIAVTALPDSVRIAATNVWRLSGNSGTDASHFLGTTDDQPLELRANNARVLRLEPNAVAPNVIAGADANGLLPGLSGASIGGGGASGAPNRVVDSFGTVGGGRGNTAGNDEGNLFDGRFATVGGGDSNAAGAEGSTVGGGSTCAALGELSTISGGGNNVATGYGATIGGGGGFSASLGVPVPNLVLSFWGTISGGSDNTVSNEFGVIGGGGGNRAAGQFAVIGGGRNNATAGDFATIPGGSLNIATGTSSLAAGHRAQAQHDGAFVWADHTDTDFASQSQDEFAVRATGGVRLVTGFSGNSPVGAQLPPGSGSWSTLSDRHMKENFKTVDGRQILQRLAQVPVTTWNYKTEQPAVRHIGPMAQDFSKAFGTGTDDKHISTVDADGVALAAIQGLYQLLQQRESELKAQRAQIQSLTERLAALEQNLPQK